MREFAYLITGYICFLEELAKHLSEVVGPNSNIFISSFIGNLLSLLPPGIGMRMYLPVVGSNGE